MISLFLYISMESKPVKKLKVIVLCTYTRKVNLLIYTSLTWRIFLSKQQEKVDYLLKFEISYLFSWALIPDVYAKIKMKMTHTPTAERW